MTTKKYIQVAAAVIECEGRYLITKREPNSHLGGYWEFPGGKREPGESLEECLKRELLEELGVEITHPQPFVVVKHEYPEKAVELHFFFSSLLSGDLQSLGCADFQWVRPDEFSCYQFPPADEPVMAKLQEQNQRK